MSVQLKDSMAIPQEPPTRADVLMNEGVYREPSFESGEREGSSNKLNVVVLVPARTEAGKHNISNEKLQPLNENPLPRKKPVQRI